MSATVVYQAPCPGCNGIATWESEPVVMRQDTLQGAHPTTIPVITIACSACDKPKRGRK